MNVCIRYFKPVSVGEEPFVMCVDVSYICQKTNVLDEFSFCHIGVLYALFLERFT